MKIKNNGIFNSINLKQNHAINPYSIIYTKTPNFLRKIKYDKYKVPANKVNKRHISWSTKKKLLNRNISYIKESCGKALKKLIKFQKRIVHNKKNRKIFFTFFKIAVFSNSLINLIKVIQVLSNQSKYDIDNTHEYINNLEDNDPSNDLIDTHDLELNQLDHEITNGSDYDNTNNPDHNIGKSPSYHDLLDVQDSFLNYIMPDSNIYQKNLFMFSFYLYNSVISGFSAAMLSIKMRNMLIKRE